MAKVLDLIYRVKDDASRPIKKIKGEQDSFNKSLDQGKKIAAASVAAITGVAVATGKLIDQYQKYTISMGDLAHAAGITTEEMSALSEISGDLGIETESLAKAFKKMAAEGIDPSIEGLINVREKLDGAKTDSERLALAQKYLGRAGMDLLPIFDQLTNEQLRDYIKGMTNAQIVTEAEYQAALENRKALEEWNDAYQSLTLSVGGFLTRGLMPYLKILLDLPAITRGVSLGMAAWWANVLGLDQATKDHIAKLGAQDEAAKAQVAQINGELIPAVGAYVNALSNIPANILTTLQLKQIGVAGGGQVPATGVVLTPIPTQSSALRGLGIAGKKAGGGPVSAGGSYMVGERGPEMFTPGASGAITPNIDQLAREIRHMVTTLPVVLRDAVAKA